MGIRTKNLHNYILNLKKSNYATTSAALSADIGLVPFSGFITNVYATMSSIGDTTATVFDVNKNGSTIFGADSKITGDTASKVIAYSDLASDNYGVSAGDIISLDIDATDATLVNAIVAITISKTPTKQPSHLSNQADAL